MTQYKIMQKKKTKFHKKKFFKGFHFWRRFVLAQLSVIELIENKGYFSREIT